MSSSIPPNILGSIVQAQVSAGQAAKNENAERNKRADDSRKLAQTHSQKQSEVEESMQTEDVIVQRQDERQRDGQDARDTWEHHRQSQEQAETLYHPDGTLHKPDHPSSLPPTPHNPTSAVKADDKTSETTEESRDNPSDEARGHIDVSA